MSKRALITGITGQDGSYLAELLLKKGYEIYGMIRRLSTPNLNNIEIILDRITLVDGDLTDSVSVIQAVSKAAPDEIYNLGSQSFVAASFTQPEYTLNATGLGVLRMLEATKQNCSGSRFYQASSSEMFGISLPPQNETTPFHPRSPYGMAKLMGHWAVSIYRSSYNIHASSGILFNHESSRRGLEFVTKKIAVGVARIKAGFDSKIILGNINAKRDWGFTPDYVEAMWLMLQQKKPDDYVIATGETRTVRDFVIEAFEVADIDNWEKYIRIDKVYQRPADVPELCGDASKARRILDWKPKKKFKEIVRIMVEHELKKLKVL